MIKYMIHIVNQNESHSSIDDVVYFGETEKEIKNAIKADSYASKDICGFYSIKLIEGTESLPNCIA